MQTIYLPTNLKERPNHYLERELGVRIVGRDGRLIYIV